jgi:hypothetical protein
MKTLNNIILTLGAAAVLGATGLYAQSAAVANVPFDFMVQTVTMPAGEYTLKPLSGPSGLIQIMNSDTHRSVLVLAPSTNSIYKGKPTEPGKVIFHRYGDRYFFSEVWTPDGLRGGVAMPKLERELQASAAGTEMASVNIPLIGAQ